MLGNKVYNIIINKVLFQRLSGFETGHPATASLLRTFEFSVSDEQEVSFLI